jgi:hypothetical protein
VGDWQKKQRYTNCAKELLEHGEKINGANYQCKKAKQVQRWIQPVNTPPIC